ncbi:hypothetical protein [Nitratireductor luteus]|uniref:hypothetical protein n=1 Tax=Nitratireductor luteus TaxID=2976980 RepID=UPI0022406658|nr:hypothetical protein [Nitratireductor luteus]
MKKGCRRFAAPHMEAHKPVRQPCLCALHWTHLVGVPSGPTEYYAETVPVFGKDKFRLIINVLIFPAGKRELAAAMSA